MPKLCLHRKLYCQIKTGKLRVNQRSPIEHKFWLRVKKTPGCWIWLGSWLRFGYGQFRSPHGTCAHRYSWALHYGPIPSGMLVLHKCDNPQCTNPEHLFLGTHQDNVDDKVSKGRHSYGEIHGMHLHPEARPVGERNGQSKLSESDVLEIRRLYDECGGKRGILTALARKYNISIEQIRRIVLRLRWRLVQEVGA